MRCIQRSIAAISKDRFTPARTTPEVTDHLIELATNDPANQLGFATFLLELPAGAFHRELLIQILPPEKRDIIHELRAQHEDLQNEKETQINNAHFDAAAATRDRQLELHRKIREHLHNTQLYITPSAIDTSLKALGWNPNT